MYLVTASILFTVLCQLTSAEISLSTIGDAMGTAGDVLGIVSFIMDAMPNPEEITGSTVTIGVAKENHDSDDFAGKVRVVWGFDNFNHVLGSSDLDTYIDDGTQTDITIHQAVNEGAQSPYVSIIAGDDEICIPYVAITYPKSSSQWVWTGDIGSHCGQAWYYGNWSYGAPDKPYYPKCTWLDTDHGDDIDNDDIRQPITLQQMKIDMQSYGSTADYGNMDFICGATIFSGDASTPIDGVNTIGLTYQYAHGLVSRAEAENNTTIDNTAGGQRVARPRSQGAAERLVVNSRPEQTAAKLCTSPTSRGSDFASVDEGLFCDMDTKTIYPLCTKQVTQDCFDLDEERLQMKMRRRQDSGLEPRGHHLVKQYKKISHWH